jgi:DNA glycosylase AlkZ-like
MKTLEVTIQRLRNQRLSHTKFKTPHEVVQWLGAVQAQDYAGAKWALAQRMTDTTDAVLDHAFNEGSILRTHVLRPTWHFVTPENIRWLLKLTAPRVLVKLATMDRQLELDRATIKRSNTIFVKTLQDGKQLTRTELEYIFQERGVNTTDLRMTYLMIHAELDGVICSGERRGKQFTYALLDERAPQTKSLTRDEALAEIVRRYFTSRGPARLQDFTWWSGLTMAEAKNGIEMVKSQLVSETIDDQAYWFSAAGSNQKEKSTTAYLLPNYDEYIVGYTSRSLIYDASHDNKLDARGNVLFQNTIVIDGQVVGTWKRTRKKNEAIVELTSFTKLTKAEKQAVDQAAERFGKFLELPVSLIHKEHTHEQGKTRSV